MSTSAWTLWVIGGDDFVHNIFYMWSSLDVGIVLKMWSYSPELVNQCRVRSWVYEVRWVAHFDCNWWFDHWSKQANSSQASLLYYHNSQIVLTVITRSPLWPADRAACLRGRWSRPCRRCDVIDNNLATSGSDVVKKILLLEKQVDFRSTIREGGKKVLA